MSSLKPSLLLSLLLIAAATTPIGAQIPLDDDDRFIKSYATPITYYTPDLFTSGVYLGTPNNYDKNNPRRPWKPLTFQDSNFHLYGPLPIPLARTFTANPSRSHLRPHSSQSFNIITTPPALPESSHYDSRRESAERSYVATDPNPWREDSTALAASERAASERAANNAAGERASEAARAPVGMEPQTASVPKRSAAKHSISKRSTVSQPGHLTFSVHPADTRVLVNDDLLGTGESLGAGQSRSLKPGVYAIEAEHGQYTTERLMFSLGSGEAAHVVIDLTAEGDDRGRVDKSKP